MIELRWKEVPEEYTRPTVVKVEANPFYEVRCVLQYRERQVDKDLVAFWTDWQDVEISDE